MRRTDSDCLAAVVHVKAETPGMAEACLPWGIPSRYTVEANRDMEVSTRAVREHAIVARDDREGS
jgi:hypothetical protein